MNHIPTEQIRIMAIAPSSVGFGFAVFEGEETLVNWGVKTVKGKDKNTESLAKAKELITHYQPSVLVLQDASAKHSRRSPRIRELTKGITALAKTHKVRVKLISRVKVMQAFFADGQGTKHALAEIMARRFPVELGDRLPAKRKAWDSEDCRMGIFEAVALVMAYFHRKKI